MGLSKRNYLMSSKVLSIDVFSRHSNMKVRAILIIENMFHVGKVLYLNWVNMSNSWLYCDIKLCSSYSLINHFRFLRLHFPTNQIKNTNISSLSQKFVLGFWNVGSAFFTIFGAGIFKSSGKHFWNKHKKNHKNFGLCLLFFNKVYIWSIAHECSLKWRQ